MKRHFSSLMYMLADIYSPKNDDSKGRLISLLSGIIASFYNVFITGIFYTGFLSAYDISITGVGIVTFIPYIASIFSVFSPAVLSHFKKRRGILVASKIFFYAMYIIATTVMPLIVKSPDGRLVWFIVIIFIAYAVFAVFSPGFTVWFYNFYPADNERRTRYIYLNSLFSNIVASVVMLLSALITDALSGSAFQNTLIIVLRYFAFVLVLLDVFAQSRAKEYPYTETTKVSLKQIFTLPFKYKKFILCMAIMFYWNFISNLNNGLWNYHLLNHIELSYTTITLVSLLYTAILLVTSKPWRQVLRRYSWVKTFGITNLLWVPTEALFFFMDKAHSYMFIPVCIFQNIVSVGLNLSWSNLLYTNLPEDNSTAHISFHTIGCNVFAFLGLMTGTLITSIGNDLPLGRFLGIEIYSVQLTNVARVITQLIMGVVCFFFWKAFTNDNDIELVEKYNKLPPKQPINIRHIISRLTRRRS